MESLEELAKSRLFDVTRHIELAANQALEVGQSATVGSTSGSRALVAVGDLVDRKYQIEALLGEGGMGVVYKANHRDLGKEVALKTFKMAALDAQAWQRFQREAQAMGKLAHPNIVQVFDFGVTEANMPFYTMEYLQGESLAERTARGGNGRLNDSLRIFVKAAGALGAAHRKGIIHRDIKPANIFLIGDGRDVKVVDFGIAGLVSEAVDGQKLTSTGSVFGSPLYMSPEQSLGLPTGTASDVYSFACTLFEVLSGAVPFRGANAFATMLMHQTKPPPTLVLESGERLPGALTSLMQAMMQKDPTLRPQSFDEIVPQLEAIIAGKDIQAKPEFVEEYSADNAGKGSPLKPIAWTAALVIFLIGLGAFFLLRPGALAPLQKQVVKAAVSPVYYQGMQGDKRLFKFPPDVSVGDIYWDGKPQSTPNFGKCIAQGEILLPGTGPLSLVMSYATKHNPAYLDGFRGDDLYRLNLPKARNQHLEHIRHLTGLKMLTLATSQCDDSAADDLNQLGGLRWLDVQPSRFTATTFENLPYLQKLEWLQISQVSHVNSLIRRLQKNPNLIGLSLIDCDLNDDDLAQLDKIPKLASLNISGNGQLDDQSLKQLHKPLAQLNIEGTKIGPASVSLLKKLVFPHKSEITVSSELWSKQARKIASEELGTPVKLRPDIARILGEKD